MNSIHDQTLATLLSRRSAWPLGEPAPAPAELEAILQAAAVAPDHAGLRPWHFKAVQGEDRQALLHRVLQHPDAQTGQVQALQGKYALKLTTAPVVIVLAARITPHPKAPEFEQLLAAGAAVMSMLNAAHLLGYSGFWSSTPEPLAALLHKVMGFGAQDRIIGLLNLGTPSNVTKANAARVSWQEYAQHWHG
ncbi:nitroreductase [Methylobacillus sp. Pita2]|uniref:nitroreductase family protein n=1 Tax=Methylobacillus sp. Pita2 TaxID=3383245 RepID=UPI0038B5D509